MSKDNLSIDIYHDNYPKPVLMNNTHSVLIIQEPVPIEEINSPKYIPQQNTNVENTNVENTSVKNTNVKNTNVQNTSVQNTIVQNTNVNHKGICALILSALMCIGIGIACILIALEENQPSEEHDIYLEGQIVYVFYLGVGIIMCVMFCLFGTCCARCCGDLCPLFI